MLVICKQQKRHRLIEGRGGETSSGGAYLGSSKTSDPSATTLRSAFLAQLDTGELALGRCFTGTSTAAYLRALTWLRAGGRAEG